jgi:hypothetical protein
MPSLGELDRAKEKEQEKEEKRKRWLEYQKRMEEIQERKVNRAKERDTRVISTKMTDTLNVVNIMIPAEEAVKKLRLGMVYRYSIEEVGNLLEEYKSIILKLSDFTKKICEKTNTPYRTPRWIEKSEEPIGKEEKTEGGEAAEGIKA